MSDIGSKAITSVGVWNNCPVVGLIYDKFVHCTVPHRILVLLYPCILLGSTCYHQAASCEQLFLSGKGWAVWIHDDVKGLNGGFRHWQVSGLVISSVAASLSSLNVHTINCASFQPLRSQHNPSRLVFGLHWCFTTILNCILFPPVHPPLPTQWKHPWYYLVHPTI